MNETMALLIATFSIPLLITGGQALVESIGDKIHFAKIKLHKKGIL